MQLSDTLAMVTSIIKGQAEVLAQCIALHIRPAKPKLEQCNCDTMSALETLNADIRHYLDTVTVLSLTTSKITQMVSAAAFELYRIADTMAALHGACNPGE